MDKEFWKYFFSAVGTISSVITLISFVFQLLHPSLLVVLVYAVSIILLSIGFACWQTHRKEYLSIKISNNLKLNVSAGDIFSYAQGTNYVVIPVNEYFDTVVDDKIINKGSVHGQFIDKYYQGNHIELHKEIEEYLGKFKVEGKEDSKRANKGGHKVKYPIGTCVNIQHEQTTFVLVAFTHFSDNDIAFVELSELGICISHLCRHLAKEVGVNAIYMPLMGTGLSRLNQSAQFILKYTLDTIVGVKDLALLGGLNIILNPETARTINLNEIKY